MGGLLIIISIVVPTLLWADLRNPYVWIAMFGLVGFGAIGFWDDYTKVRKKRNLGLTARQKFWLQVAVCLAIGVASCWRCMPAALLRRRSTSRFFKQFQARPADRPCCTTRGRIRSRSYSSSRSWSLVIAGASNAVNLTDGLDGLAIGSDDHRGRGDDDPVLRQRPRASSRNISIWRVCPARRS